MWFWVYLFWSTLALQMIIFMNLSLSIALSNGNFYNTSTLQFINYNGSTPRFSMIIKWHCKNACYKSKVVKGCYGLTFVIQMCFCFLVEKVKFLTLQQMSYFWKLNNTMYMRCCVNFILLTKVALFQGVQARFCSHANSHNLTYKVVMHSSTFTKVLNK